MAERWAVADGVWNNPATWNGGTVPDPGDDVHAGGYSVQMPAGASLTVKSLRLAAGSSAPAGGRFWYSADSHLDELIITDGILTAHHQTGNATTGARTYIIWVDDCDYAIKITTPTIEGGGGNYRSAIGVNVTGTATLGTGAADLTLDVSSGAGIKGGTATTGAYGVIVDDGEVTVLGDITGGGSNNAYGLSAAGSGTVTVTGDITGGSSSFAYGMNVSGGTVTVTGDITGGSSSNAHGMNVTGSATITILGGSVIRGAIADGINHNSSIPITITADIVGGSNSNAAGLRLSTAREANITGTVTGGTVANSYGILVPNNAILNITGDIHGSPTTNAAGINVTSGCLVRIDGTLYASQYAPAVNGENTLPIAAKHMQNHPTGRAATQCAGWVIWDADDATIGVYTDLAWPSDPEGSAAVLTRFGTDLPTQANVRNGVTYGPGGTLTGTLEAGGASLADIAAVTGAQIAAATNS